MLVFRKKGSVVGGVHYVYTTAEARENKIRPIADWRKCQIDDWVRTDDGWVGRILDVRYYLDKRRTHSQNNGKDVYTKFIATAFGRTTDRSPGFELRKMIGSGQGISSRPIAYRIAESLRGRLFVMYYCISILSTGKIDYIELGKIACSGNLPAVNARILLRHPVIQKKIEEAMSKMLEKKGITHESVLDDYKNIKEKALKDGKYKEALEVLSKFEKWTGLDTLINSGENNSPMGALPPSDEKSEERMLMDRFNEIAEDPPAAEPSDQATDDSDAQTENVPVPNRYTSQGYPVTDGDGNPVYEVGRGD